MSLFNNLIQVFDKFGRPKSRTQLVESAQATQLLKNVDDMLDESLKMLTTIKSKIPDREFNSYEHDHNQLYVMVVDVKSDIRGREKNQVFFASAAERDAFYIRMRKLLERCEVHHTDVLSASRKAYLQASRQTIDLEPTPTTPAPVEQAGTAESGWLSIVTESAPSQATESAENHTELSLVSQSDSESSNSSQQFIATVAHIPKSALASEEELKSQLPDDDSYYRIVICGNKRKRAVVVDPHPHPISSSYEDEQAERSQDEILRVADMLMKSNPEQLEGHPVVQSYQGPSFISSFISSWSYNGLPL